jgi:competence protein ComEA
MQDEGPFNKLLNLVEKYQLALILGLLGVLFVGLGILYPRLSLPKKEEINFESAKETQESKIKVDVSGAVKNPGVYDLEEGARVLDAIYSAGGFSDQVDNAWLAKSLNLAASVTDGQKIYINTLSDSSNTLGSNIAGVESKQGKVNINSASASELDTLSGVGEVTADKIISARPYQSVEELLTRKIVGKATYEKIKDQISVY